jgi:hypothetical protein
MRSTLLLLTVLVCVAAGTAEAQPAPSILFVGNSFTFGYGSAARYYRSETVTDLNDEGIGGVPALFESFADQAGLDYDVYLETRGGSGFEFHLENKLAELQSHPWDIVVAHGQSTLDLRQPRDATKFLETGAQFVEAMLEVNPGMRLYMTATWSRADETYPDDGAWHGEPIEVMAREVRAAYDRLAREVHGITAVTPVGEAWTRAMETGVADPNPYDGIGPDRLDLWTYDHYHASAAGYYLEAAVVFGVVTGVDPVSLGDTECSGFELGLSESQVGALLEVAHDELDAEGVAMRQVDITHPRRAVRCAAP